MLEMFSKHCKRRRCSNVPRSAAHHCNNFPRTAAHLKTLQGTIPPSMVDCNADGGCKLDRDAGLLKDESSRFSLCSCCAKA